MSIKLSPKELETLPPALIEQLSKSKVYERHQAILAAIKAAGEEACVDAILIGFHKNTGIVMKRQHLLNNLHRMVKAGLITSLKNRKGFYAVK